jgi:hypothetical protein
MRFTTNQVNAMREQHTSAPDASPHPAAPATTKVGWRPDEWARAAGLSRGTLFNLLKAGKIEAVKSGTARIILTSPADYLDSLRGKVA